MIFMKKITSLFALLFVIIPTFALESSDTEKEIVSLDSPVLETGTTETNKVIHDLNIEFNRLSSKGYTHDDYDISDPMRNIIMNAIFPPEIEYASQIEKDRWARDRISLFESFNDYVENIPDRERKILFERARNLIWEFTFVD